MSRPLITYSQVANHQAELTYLHAHLATLELPSPQLPAPPMPTPAPFSISDLPSSTNIPTTVDLSALFDPPAQPQWGLQQQHPQHQLRQLSYGAPASRATSGMAESSAGGGDLQALARELLDRHRSGVKPEQPPPPPPHSR